MKLTEKKRRIGRMRAVVSMAACVVLGIATAGSAVALRMGVDSPGKGSDQQIHKKGGVYSIPAGKMQENLISKVTPKYPPEAKVARIQGTVELDAVITKVGRVNSLKVISGPAALQQSAMDAVRQWRYKPFLLNGKPIEVETTVTVVYTLANLP